MEEEESDTSKKSADNKPRRIASEPDHSLQRYSTLEFQTQTRRSKEVPFEAIDRNLYKAKAQLVGFRTSETRLQPWIGVIIARYVDFLHKQEGFSVSWEEIESPLHPDKPDKIQLSVKEGDIKLFVISIFITTGRIQVQGSCWREWSETEFPLFMQMIEQSVHGDQTSPSFISFAQMPLFTKINDVELSCSEDSDISSSEDGESDDSSSEDEECVDDQHVAEIPKSPCVSTVDLIHSSDEKDVIKHSDSSQNIQNNSTQDHGIQNDNNEAYPSSSVKLLADTLADLEGNFINTKIHLENELYKVQASLDEVLFLKDKVVQVENSNKATIAGFDDRLYANETNVNSVISATIGDLSSQVKKLQEQKGHLSSKQTQLKSDVDQIKKENEQLKKELFVIKEILQKHENALETDKMSPADEDETTNLSQGPQPQLVNQEQSLLLLIDSNGKFIKPNILYPDQPVKFRKTYTLEQVTMAIETFTGKPSTVLIHCGTNDLENKSADEVVDESKQLLSLIKRKFDDTKIIYSSLLPRNDSI